MEGDAAGRVTQLMKSIVETLRMVLVTNVSVARDHRALVQPHDRDTQVTFHRIVVVGIKLKPDKFFRTAGCQRSTVSHNFTCSPTRAHPALTPAGEGWYSIYLPPRDGRLSWPRCLITRGPGIEPMTARSKVRRPNHCATKYIVHAQPAM